MTKFYSLNIANIRPETDSAICLSFNIPEELKETFTFTPGQFLTLQVSIDGEDVRRCYSICSGIDEAQLSVAIKRVEEGVFSNFANDNFKVGDNIEVMAPQGDFTLKTLDSQNNKNYMLLAAGSGITPILSLTKSILAREPNSQITLVYGNQKTLTMMFKEELSFIKNRYLTRFNWVNIMSQEDQGADLLNGRIDNKKGYQLQKQKVIDINTTDEAFICGPESMISEVSRGFRIEGLAEDQIHYELFASSSEDAQLVLKKAKNRVHEYGEKRTSKVTVIADGRSNNFDLATVGANILDAGMANGVELPYSCKAGVCSTCKAKLVKGQVDMDISHGLEQHEIDAGYILTCQSHPITDEVVVSFDDR
ncbi:1,2-phenylacetyl-CoA epoxidase subunit PaaE [Candidatus Colwellia aromaticivorans]|uniref:1,2-phenylacetyl-CoA epoxidase subunit PaaE n=1 Tax=Candidatus Colwellia aromaticivorans TaxID=2267621 RepID=UPI000DF2F527|nr:1,2-phenylacetyl-CoA epoxidase subunit PaaE [Candidatus Colwellia aromaticivorans]